MERKNKTWIIALLFLAVALVTIYFFAFKETEVSAPQPTGKSYIEFERLPQLDTAVYENADSFTIHPPACVNVYSSGESSEKIDIVFLPEDYSDLGKFERDVMNYIDASGEKGGIFSVEPFKSNPDKFNFYLVNRSSDLECQLGCFGVDRLVCCKDDRVKEVASQCPYDQAVVLIDTKEFCGASKDYAGVCTIEDPRAGLVLVHELGHTIAGLGDEYSYGRQGSTNAPNCDVAGCQKWAGVPETGCFETCGYTNLFRPTLRDSLMNVYIPQFDSVSTNRFLDIFLTYSTDSDAVNKIDKVFKPAIQLDKSYVASLSYFGGEVSLNDIYTVNTSFSEPIDGEEYVGRIVDFNGNPLDIIRIKLPKDWYSFYDPSATEENKKEHIAIKPQIFDYTFNAPYFKNAQKLEIYDLQGNKLDEIKLSPFAQTCGDGICQEQENYLECRADCPLTKKDNLCIPYPDDNICDPDCPAFGKFSDSNCKKNLVWTNTAIIIVLAAVLLLMHQMLKSQKRRI